MRLLIVRHAIAMERADFATIDADDGLRPLTSDGVRKMRAAARGLRELVRRPDVLLSSPLERARATAAILRERAWPGLQARECRALIPGRQPLALLEELRRIAGESGSQQELFVAAVGHDPHLSLAVGWFLSGRERIADPRAQKGAKERSRGSRRPAGAELAANFGAEASKAPVELRKGGACLLEFPEELGAGSARLSWLLQPKHLRALAH